MSKRKCEATNRRGEPCNASANENGFCFTHDATKGKERALARRKGGLQRITPHVADASLVPREPRSIEGAMITLDTYSHVSPTMQKAATEKLEKLLYGT